MLASRLEVRVQGSNLFNKLTSLVEKIRSTGEAHREIEVRLQQSSSDEERLSLETEFERLVDLKVDLINRYYRLSGQGVHVMRP